MGHNTATTTTPNTNYIQYDTSSELVNVSEALRALLCCAVALALLGTVVIWSKGCEASERVMPELLETDGIPLTVADVSDSGEAEGLLIALERNLDYLDQVGSKKKSASSLV